MAGSLVVKGNKYYAKFRINGTQKLLATGVDVKGNNKRRAEKVMQEIIAEYSKLDLSNGKILFTTFLEEWLENMKGLLKPSTWETYDKTIHGKVIPYFARFKVKLIDLKPQQLSDYFLYLSVSGKSNGNGGLGKKSVRNIKGVISSALDDAVKNKYIPVNPIIESRMPAFENSIKKEVTSYTVDEVKCLLECAEKSESHIYVFLLLALFTGLRKGELLALTWSDIDFDRKTLTVNKSRTGTRKDVTMKVTTPKTDSSNRTIPLNDKVIEALKAERQRQKENAALMGNCYHKSVDYIVRTVDGRPYSNLSAINRVLNRLTEKAGLPHCTVHGLRHTVASMLDDSGVPIQDISVLLGHKRVSTTEQIYIHRNRKAKIETVSVLDRLIN